MAKGASANSGPPPDPNSLRSDRSGVAGWTTLPADGREGDTPEFPLTNATPRELEVWEREWRRPQAIEWERNGQQDEVAFYVRSFVEAEAHHAPVASRTLVKQLQEALGISLPGLARNRWRIGPLLTAASKSTGQRARRSGGRSRDRFEVIDGGTST